MQNKLVETFIKNYVEAVDAQDLEKTAALTAPDFRIVMKSNRDRDKITLLSKSDYLKLMEEKKVGGSKRSVHIQSCTRFAESMNVCLLLENEKLKMESIYSLVEHENNWQVLSDQLFVTFK